MKIVNVLIDDLIPAHYNPRKLNDKQFKEIKDSLTEFGFVDAVIVNNYPGRENIIVGGHQRVKVWGSLGNDTVPVFYVSLTEKKERELNVRLNKNHGEFDFDILKLEFDEEDLIDWGFDDEEFDITILEPEETTGDDDVPEHVEPLTVKGDLYELGEHRLLCGDSTMIDDVEKLMGGVKADMVFTDPPYGYKYESNHQAKHEMLKNDDVILDFLPLCESVMEENSAIYLCTSHQVIDKWKPLISENFNYKNMIIWKKNNWSMGDLKGAYAGQHEIIIFAHKGKVSLEGKRDSDIWEFDREAPGLHPTIKPIELIQYAITKIHSKRVLDLFLGSGSTLIACEKTKRRCFGMELDEKYCDVIVKRYADFCKKNNKPFSVKRNGKIIDKS